MNFKDYLKSLGFTIKVENIDPRDPSFATLRSESFGGSDSSKLLGVNPYDRGTLDELIIDKITKYHNPDISKKPIVRMGAELEDFILNRFVKATNWNIHKPNDMWWEEKTMLAMNFDGIVSTGSSSVPYLPAEVKLVSEWGRVHYDFRKAVNVDKKGTELNKKVFPAVVTLDYIEQHFDELQGDTTLAKYIIYVASLYGVPEYYYTQLQQEIYFTNAPYGFILAMDIKLWTLFGFRIRRDDYVISELQRIAKGAKIDYETLINSDKESKILENPL